MFFLLVLVMMTSLAEPDLGVMDVMDAARLAGVGNLAVVGAPREAKR